MSPFRSLVAYGIKRYIKLQLQLEVQHTYQWLPLGIWACVTNMISDTNFPFYCWNKRGAGRRGYTCGWLTRALCFLGNKKHYIILRSGSGNEAIIRRGTFVWYWSSKVLGHASPCTPHSPPLEVDIGKVNIRQVLFNSFLSYSPVLQHGRALELGTRLHVQSQTTPDRDGHRVTSRPPGACSGVSRIWGRGVLKYARAKRAKFSHAH